MILVKNGLSERGRGRERGEPGELGELGVRVGHLKPQSYIRHTRLYCWVCAM